MTAIAAAVEPSLIGSILETLQSHELRAAPIHGARNRKLYGDSAFVTCHIYDALLAELCINYAEKRALADLIKIDLNYQDYRPFCTSRKENVTHSIRVNKVAQMRGALYQLG